MGVMMVTGNWEEECCQSIAGRWEEECASANLVTEISSAGFRKTGRGAIPVLRYELNSMTFDCFAVQYIHEGYAVHACLLCGDYILAMVRLVFR